MGGTCTSWTATVGKCSQCDTKKGACSAANPSSITSATEISFYGDATCSSSQFLVSIPITVDGKCYAMPSGMGSVKAGNVSAIIGGVVGAFFLVLIVSICLCKRFGCCGKRCCCGCGPPEAARPAQPAALIIAAPSSSYGAPSVYPAHAGYAVPEYAAPPPGHAPHAYYAAPPPGVFAPAPGAFYAPSAPYAPGGPSSVSYVEVPAAKVV
jgi:hypothetical protein